MFFKRLIGTWQHGNYGISLGPRDAQEMRILRPWPSGRTFPARAELNRQHNFIRMFAAVRTLTRVKVPIAALVRWRQFNSPRQPGESLQNAKRRFLAGTVPNGQIAVNILRPRPSLDKRGEQVAPDRYRECRRIPVYACCHALAGPGSACGCEYRPPDECQSTTSKAESISFVTYVAKVSNI